MDELIYASAAFLARAIREKKVSCVEVVEAHLQRIEAVNPRLNAVVQLAAETARAEAREADAALARGELRGPLHGVPFTVKDWIETAGVVCAAGIDERRNYVPKHDATVVARMRAAGAIMLGKTMSGNDNPVYGVASNPYDLARTPGGSSSGEAVIIAAGGSPLGLGSDSGGSIRFPAHCCGVAALKPSAGLVPNTGHFPRIGALSDPRTQIGPMARFVEDLALALPLIAGVDWRDPGVVPMPFGDPDAVELRSLRVATFTSFEGAKPTAETVETIRNAARSLEEAGATVEEAVPSRIEESWAITKAYWARARSHSWREWLPAGRGADMTAEEIERSIFEWDRLRRAFLGFIERYDAIVCPVAEHAAGSKGDERDTDFIFTLPYSLTGWPCAVVRAGTSPEGLPIDVQVVARPWRDDVALAVAGRIENVLGGWRPPSM